MESTKFLAFLRGVRIEAARWGYGGDVLTEPDRIPLVGTVEQQHHQATIYLDVEPRPANEKEREFLKRLIRAAVLTAPRRTGPEKITEPVTRRPQPKMARAW